MPQSENLLAGCLRKDAKSQKEFYDLYKARIMGLCRRYSKNREEAEDIYQEIFVRVFKNISQLKDHEHLDQWIKKISINTAVNYFHKNKRHSHVNERDGFLHENDDYNLILSQFSDSMLIKIINELPDGYRMVFNLHEVEGYSHSEIGELLNISEVTSRSQLNRAKQTLRCKLKEYGIVKYESYG